LEERQRRLIELLVKRLEDSEIEVVHQQRWETVEFWAMISETETTLISFPLSMSAVGNFDVNFALVMEQLMVRQAVAFVA